MRRQTPLIERCLLLSRSSHKQLHTISSLEEEYSYNNIIRGRIFIQYYHWRKSIHTILSLEEEYSYNIIIRGRIFRALLCKLERLLLMSSILLFPLLISIGIFFGHPVHVKFSAFPRNKSQFL